MNTELISLILNLLFGGGLLVTIVTLRSERKKAMAKAKDAELDTIEKATKILMDSIVTPLRKELADVRKEITRLRKAILTASNAGGAVPSSIANGDILTIPEGTSQVFFNTTTEVSIALVRGAGSIGRFPRNGVRITIAGNWKPQEGGGYSGSNAVGRFSSYLYVYRGGVASASANYRMTHAFEDFMYFNGVWYSKGY